MRCTLAGAGSVVAGFLEEVVLTCCQSLECVESREAALQLEGSGNQGWETRRALWSLPKAGVVVGRTYRDAVEPWVKGWTPVRSGFKSGSCTSSSVT